MGNDLIHAACHEAGHAVIGHVLKLPCHGATIVPDEDSLGHVLPHDPWDAYSE